MGLFERLRGRGKAEDWTPVRLHVVEARRPRASDESSPGAYTPYDFDLEVRPEGGPPYRIRHSEKVARSVVAPGLLAEQKIPNGIDLTGWVRVDDPNVVAIDWSSYRTIEARASVEDARQAEIDATYMRTVLAKASPKMQQQLRSNASTSVRALAEAVRDGHFSRDEWEKQFRGDLRRTLITQEQYDEAVAIIEGR